MAKINIIAISVTLLVIFQHVTSAEKRIRLEDIEQDNLRSELARKLKDKYQQRQHHYEVEEQSRPSSSFNLVDHDRFEYIPVNTPFPGRERYFQSERRQHEPDIENLQNIYETPHKIIYLHGPSAQTESVEAVSQQQRLHEENYYVPNGRLQTVEDSKQNLMPDFVERNEEVLNMEQTYPPHVPYGMQRQYVNHIPVPINFGDGTPKISTYKYSPSPELFVEDNKIVDQQYEYKTEVKYANYQNTDAEPKPKYQQNYVDPNHPHMQENRAGYVDMSEHIQPTMSGAPEIRPQISEDHVKQAPKTYVRPYQVENYVEEPRITNTHPPKYATINHADQPPRFETSNHARPSMSDTPPKFDTNNYAEQPPRFNMYNQARPSMIPTAADSQSYISEDHVKDEPKKIIRPYHENQVEQTYSNIEEPKLVPPPQIQPLIPERYVEQEPNNHISESNEKVPEKHNDLPKTSEKQIDFDTEKLGYGEYTKQTPNNLLQSYIPSSIQIEFLKRGLSMQPKTTYDIIARSLGYPVENFKTGFVPYYVYEMPNGEILVESNRRHYIIHRRR